MDYSQIKRLLFLHEFKIENGSLSTYLFIYLNGKIVEEKKKKIKVQC